MFTRAFALAWQRSSPLAAQARVPLSGTGSGLPAGAKIAAGSVALRTGTVTASAPQVTVTSSDPPGRPPGPPPHPPPPPPRHASGDMDRTCGPAALRRLLRLAGPHSSRLGAPLRLAAASHWGLAFSGTTSIFLCQVVFDRPVPGRHEWSFRRAMRMPRGVPRSCGTMTVCSPRHGGNTAGRLPTSGLKRFSTQVA